MPDFIKENGLNEDEKQLQIEKELQLNKNHFLQVQESERKSLYEQLQDAKVEKQAKYDEMIAARNSSYKLDEKSAQFLESKRIEALEKEAKDKEKEKQELHRFRILKNKPAIKVEKQTIVKRPLVIKKTEQKIIKVVDSIGNVPATPVVESENVINNEQQSSKSVLQGLAGYSTEEEEENEEE